MTKIPPPTSSGSSVKKLLFIAGLSCGCFTLLSGQSSCEWNDGELPSPTPPDVTPSIPPSPLIAVEDLSGLYDLALFAGSDCSLAGSPWQVTHFLNRNIVFTTNGFAGTYEIEPTTKVGIVGLAEPTSTTVYLGGAIFDPEAIDRVAIGGIFTLGETILCTTAHLEQAATASRIVPGGSSSYAMIEDLDLQLNSNPTADGGTEVIPEARIVINDGAGMPVAEGDVVLAWSGAVNETVTVPFVDGLAIASLSPLLFSAGSNLDLELGVTVLDVVSSLEFDPSGGDVDEEESLKIEDREWELRLHDVEVGVYAVEKEGDPETMQVFGYAVITVEDAKDHDNRVDDALASGGWSGSVSGSSEAMTVDGVGLVLSPVVEVTKDQVGNGEVRLQFQFTADSVSKDYWTDKGDDRKDSEKIDIDLESWDEIAAR